MIKFNTYEEYLDAIDNEYGVTVSMNKERKEFVFHDEDLIFHKVDEDGYVWCSPQTVERCYLTPKDLEALLELSKKAREENA